MGNLKCPFCGGNIIDANNGGECESCHKNFVYTINPNEELKKQAMIENNEKKNELERIRKRSAIIAFFVTAVLIVAVGTIYSQINPNFEFANMFANIIQSF